jgi:hypothetical protein
VFGLKKVGNEAYFVLSGLGIDVEKRVLFGL